MDWYTDFLSRLYPKGGLLRVEGVDSIFDTFESETHASGISAERVKAAIHASLLAARLSTGSTCMEQADLYNSISARLKLTREELDAAKENVRLWEMELIEAGSIVREKFSTGIFYSRPNEVQRELVLLLQIQKTLNHEKRLNIAHDQVVDALDQLTQKSAMELTNEQKAAIINAVSRDISLICGGPGTGKTTLLNFLVKLVRQCVPDAEIVLAAPTGKAARRLETAVGEQASTLHSFLKWRHDADWQYDKEDIFSCHLVIVDEASMLSLEAARRLLYTVAPDTRIVFVGDYNQLPPIDAGMPFRDLIKSGVLPCTKLTAYHRQARGSEEILSAARQVVGTKKLILFPFRDGTTIQDVVHFIEKSGVQEIQMTAIKAVRDLHDRLGVDYRDIQVLTPVNGGGCGTIELNERLRWVMNPSAGPGVFSVGDRVVNKINNRAADVYNGEVGVVKAVLDGKLEVLFEDRTVTLPEDRFELAYAATVHRAQGSEFPVVVLVLHGSMGKALNRSMLYTAFTRAKEKVVVIGSRKDIRQAVSNRINDVRKTLLEQRLRDGIQPDEASDGFTAR